MKQWIQKIKEKIKKICENEYFRVFWLVFAIGVIGFAVEALSNHFTLLISGDYVLQTVPFYSHGYTLMKEFLRTGEYPFFDFSNFLGANSMGANSFYYMFSPLFYLLLLWPEKFLMQGIFFHMIFKYALGGLFFYILLRRYFKVSVKMSQLGAVVYAFSGWSLFYLWFHYSDVVALMPLMFIGVERCLQEKKGGVLTLSVFLMGITSYFFFVPFAMLIVLYALYRWIYIYGINKKRGFSAKERWSVLGQGIGFYLCGFLMAMAVFIPSLLVVAQSSRTQTSYLLDFLGFFFQNPNRVDGSLILGKLKSFKEFFSGSNIKGLWNYLFVWPKRGNYPGIQSAGYVVSSFLFMNVDCWSSTIFNNSSLDNLIGGMFITTPLTLMLIPSIARACKKPRPWTIFGIIISILLPFLPFSYYLFHGFTQLYGRWQLFMVVIAILFIITSYDKFTEIDKEWITVNLIVNVGVSLFFIAKSKKIGTLNHEDKEMVIIGELIFMFVVWAFLRFKAPKLSMEKLQKVLSVFMIGEVMISMVVTIEHKGVENYTDFYGIESGYPEQKEVIQYIKDNDDSFYRIYNAAATRQYVNLPAALSYNGASVFNSIYNYNTQDFINAEKMAYGGSWTMGYHEKRYFYDTFTGMKYYIVNKTDKNNDGYKNDDVYDGKTRKEETRQEYNLNIPFGYTLYKEFATYDVYVNDNYVQLGAGYDTIISESSVLNGSEAATIYEDTYSQMVIVEKEDMDELREILTEGIYRSSYASQRAYDRNFKKTLSLREDCNTKEKGCTINQDTTYERKDVVLAETDSAKIQDMKNAYPENSVFFHKRWESQKFFGDQLIFENNAATPQVCPLATKENQCYLNIKFRMGPNVLISLYNGDKLVTQDAHMVHGYQISEYLYEWKVQRGFYVDQPITKIVIEFVSDTSFKQFYHSTDIVSTKYEDFGINYLYESQTKERIRSMKENAVQDIVYKADNFRFKTNYTRPKMVALNIPFDDGWKLLKNGEEQKIYKVNGGFVGFVAPEGNNEYQLSYTSPGWAEGLNISVFGLLFFLILSCFYMTLEQQKEFQRFLNKIIGGKENV